MSILYFIPYTSISMLSFFWMSDAVGKAPKNGGYGQGIVDLLNRIYPDTQTGVLNLSSDQRGQRYFHFNVLYARGDHVISQLGLFTALWVYKLSNFSKNSGMQSYKTGFRVLHRLIFSHFCYSRSKMASIPTIFNGKHIKFLRWAYFGLKSEKWPKIC